MVPKIQDFVKNAEMDAESTHWPATVSSSTPSQPIITEAFRARKNSQNLARVPPRRALKLITVTRF